MPSLYWPASTSGQKSPLKHKPCYFTSLA
uniref:Uncharacterized protein n=1 Tax=Anguilla anguilla TaxID=7936 RepID=A0A0E9QHT2_ANGAN